MDYYCNKLSILITNVVLSCVIWHTTCDNIYFHYKYDLKNYIKVNYNTKMIANNVINHYLS